MECNELLPEWKHALLTMWILKLYSTQYCQQCQTFATSEQQCKFSSNGLQNKNYPVSVQLIGNNSFFCLFLIKALSMSFPLPKMAVFIITCRDDQGLLENLRRVGSHHMLIHKYRQTSHILVLCVA